MNLANQKHSSCQFLTLSSSGTFCTLFLTALWVWELPTNLTTRIWFPTEMLLSVTTKKQNLGTIQPPVQYVPYWGLITWSQAEHSTPSTTHIKNVWNHTSIHSNLIIIKSTKTSLLTLITITFPLTYITTKLHTVTIFVIIITHTEQLGIKCHVLHTEHPHFLRYTDIKNVRTPNSAASELLSIEKVGMTSRIVYVWILNDIYWKRA
jgi:hypothetical protein